MSNERSFKVTEPAKPADHTLPKENTSEVHQSIIEQFAGLPVRDRLKMLQHLVAAGHIDADNLSSGKVETNGHYDKVKEIYADEPIEDGARKQVEANLPYLNAMKDIGNQFIGSGTREIENNDLVSGTQIVTKKQQENPE